MSNPDRSAAPDPLLTRLQRATEASAAQVQTLHVAFLLFCTYFALTLWNTTHEQYVQRSAVTLPLFDVGLPVVQFYIIGPLLLALFHLIVLLQVHLLHTRLRAIATRLAEVPPDERNNEECVILYDPHLVSRALIGMRGAPLLFWSLRFVLCLTMAAFPLFLLLWTELRFIPYHSRTLSWFHVAIVVVDVAMVSVWWPSPIDMRGPALPRKRLAASAAWLLAAIAVLSCSVYYAAERRSAASARSARGLTASLLALPPRHLSLVGSSLVAEAPPPELLATHGDDAWRLYALGLELSGRDLVLADMSRARLVRANLRGANLSGAILRQADLRDADLFNADLRGADLFGAKLQGALLEGANLEGAVLERAQLQGATLTNARLSGAFMVAVNAQAADFRGAHLEGACLIDAALQSTDLSGAHLQGVTLRRARLWDTLLKSADLTLADLREARTESLGDEMYRELQVSLGHLRFDAGQRQHLVQRLEAGRGVTGIVSLAEARRDLARYNAGGAFVVPLSPLEEAIERQIVEAVCGPPTVAYLVELACNNRSVAKGIARRASYEQDASLAKGLVIRRCAPLATLAPGDRAPLERLAGIPMAE